jgi:endogenous inhibitor of DNA gyrase (YacG/DUF329 family)
MQAKCPVCGKLFEADFTSPGFPFCSKRCKLIDLGRWLDGSNNLPVTEPEGEREQDEE